MDDVRIGAVFRAIRVRRGWRQLDVAMRARVARSTVSEIERGNVGSMPIDRLRRVANVLDIRIDIIARWRGGELDRVLNAGHSAMHESVAGHLISLPGWSFVPEVSFSVYGERGVIDILAFHEASGCLLVIELKTQIVDVNELVGTLDRKARLAPRIAAGRGWTATSVSRWLIVARDRTVQRRIADHRTMLRAAFPADGHAMRRWLGAPQGSLSAMSMWTVVAPGGASAAPRQRVRVRATLHGRQAA